MEFITQSSGKKRQMVFLPEVNPDTFLLFFEKGNTGYSWSLRDYSVANSVVERYARDLGWSSSEVRQRARFLFDAPTVDVGQLRFWHDYTISGNVLLKNNLSPATRVVTKDAPVVQIPDHYPVLKIDALRMHPKAAKRGDLDRMLYSPQSEDWVTWNLFNLLREAHPLDWWSKILGAARAANPQIQVSIEEKDQPRLEFWRRVSSPSAYEQASRTRMRQSPDPFVAARSCASKPVEGDSEIDVVLSTNRHLIFAEAKLESDISMRTTYDPCRNQIVRNIDCLLDSAASREPFFWMFVKDRGPGRTYCQLVDEYRKHPEALVSHLPHRDPEILQRVAQNIAIIRWTDLAASLLEIVERDSAETQEVKKELKRRIEAGVPPCDSRC